MAGGGRTGSPRRTWARRSARTRRGSAAQPVPRAWRPWGGPQGRDRGGNGAPPGITCARWGGAGGGIPGRPEPGRLLRRWREADWGGGRCAGLPRTGRRRGKRGTPRLRGHGWSGSGATGHSPPVGRDPRRGAGRGKVRGPQVPPIPLRWRKCLGSAPGGRWFVIRVEREVGCLFRALEMGMGHASQARPSRRSLHLGRVIPSIRLASCFLDPPRSLSLGRRDRDSQEKRDPASQEVEEIFKPLRTSVGFICEMGVCAEAPFGGRSAVKTHSQEEEPRVLVEISQLSSSGERRRGHVLWSGYLSGGGQGCVIY